jgi:hypothetical protein
MRIYRALAAAALSLCITLPASAKGPEGCLWGLFQSNTPVSLDGINNTEMTTGKKAGMIMFFIDWTFAFPAEDCARIVQYGAIPHVTWEPWIDSGKKPLKTDDIANGRYDTYIKQWARDARDFKYPFFLRLGHEMNGDWYPWSAAKNGYKTEVYVKMYRRVHDIFKDEGANNVIWLWCPMNADFPDSPWNKCSKYYPGNEYVDWVGMDAYNWGKDQGGGNWISLQRLIKNRYQELVGLYPDKPMMLGEFGSGNGGGDKAAWIREALTAIREEFPAIKAIVWFNIKKERDWRIQSSEATVSAFTEQMKSGYFKSDPEYMSQLMKDFKLPPDAQRELKKLVITWDKPTVLCRLASAAPVIDGVIGKDEWLISESAGGDNPLVDISGKKQVVMKSGNVWRSEKDLSAKTVFMWDDKNLYMQADVTDANPLINNSTNDKIWDGDAVEVAFGLNPDSDPDRKTFVPSDYQVAFLAVDSLKKSLGTWSWQLGGPVKGVVYAVAKKKNGSGYIMEASIPWASFTGFIPKENMKIPFDMALNDAVEKEKGRAVQMVWTGTAAFYENPAMWGWIKFVK